MLEGKDFRGVKLFIFFAEFNNKFACSIAVMLLCLCFGVRAKSVISSELPLSYDEIDTTKVSELNVLSHLASGTSCFKSGDIVETWKHWDYCLAYVSQAAHSALTAEVYFNIGETLGEVDAATSILLFRKSMMIFSQNEPIDKAMEYRCLKEIINLYVNIAIDANTLQDVDLAAKYYSAIADSILVDTMVNVVESDAATSIYRLSTESLMWLGEDSLASEYVAKLLSNKKAYEDENLKLAYAHILYGIDAYIKEENEESIRYFNLAIEEIGSDDSYLNVQLELPYAYLGAIYCKQNKFDSAIECMEKSIKCLMVDNYETIDDSFRLLPYADLHDANHAFNIILCLERLQNFYQISLASNFSEEQLHDFYALSHYTRHFIKAWFLNASSEEILVETARLLKVCDETIVDVMYAYSTTDNVDEIFKLATEPGAFYLRYLIQLKEMGSADDTEETRLLKEINGLTVSLVSSSYDEASTSYVGDRLALIRAKTLLSDHQKNHITLLDRQRELGALQQSLDGDVLLVKYLVSAENVYLIACTQNEKKVVQMRFADYEKHLKQVRRAVKTGSGKSNSQRYFYDKLIAPILSMAVNKTNLYVLNDESLADLPFEVMQDASGDFLVNRFNVKYYYSAQSIGNSSLDITSINNVLAFAPVTFSNEEFQEKQVSLFRHASLKTLVHSKEEVNAIGRLCNMNNINSGIFVGELATKEIFKKLAEEADILHVATHGVDLGQYEKGLVFAGDSYGEQVLLASELYGMDLNCSLVVLSACKTAVGQVAQGEGVMALPRSFIYAGAPNVLAAMWNVDDEKTTEFISAFYSNLFEYHDSYSDALRKTKLDCIQNGWLPMDWAAFVLISK